MKANRTATSHALIENGKTIRAHINNGFRVAHSKSRKADILYKSYTLTVYDFYNQVVTQHVERLIVLSPGKPRGFSARRDHGPANTPL